MTKQVAYLASPYTHPDPKIRRRRHRAVTYMAYRLLEEGQLVYSPLTHNVPIDRVGDWRGTWKEWSDFDHSMVARCDKVLVLKLPGWEKSPGVTAEVAHANQLGIPVEGLEPLPEVLEDQFHLEASCECLGQLVTRMQTFFGERQWEQWHSPKNLVMSLSSEMGELAQLFRWLTEEESRNPDQATLVEATDEIGDLVINLVYLAHRLGIDPVQAALDKLKKIGERYPVSESRGSIDKR